MIIVFSRYAITMRRKRDRIVGPYVKLFSKLSGQRRKGVRELFRGDEGHRKEDLTHVYPPAPGSYGYPIWKKPTLHINMRRLVWPEVLF